MEELITGKQNVVETMENFEFIIACLIKAISVLGSEKSMMDRVNEIYSKKEDYLRKYFNLDLEQTEIFDIIHFIEFKNNFALEVDEINNRIEKFCISWNKCYELIFGESEEYLRGDDLKLIVKDLKYVYDSSEFEKYIKIPVVNYNLVVNLLDFFKDEKAKNENNHVKAVIKKKEIFQYIAEKKYSDNQKELIFYNITYLHIIEALQSSELKQQLKSNIIKNNDIPIIKNEDGIFILSEKRNFFCAIVNAYVEAYNKKYVERNNSTGTNKGVNWSRFDNCMKYKDGKKLMLKNNNKKKLKMDDDYIYLINKIIKYIFEYVKELENQYSFDKLVNTNNQPHSE